MTENGGRAGTDGDERFDKVGEETSTAVTHAASVLEQELSTGLAPAQRLEERFTAERKVDPEALAALVDQVRTSGHALIDTVAAQLPMPEGDERAELTRRYTTDAHDVLDTVLNLAKLAPDIANGLVDRLTATGTSGTRPTRDDDPPGRPGQ